MKIYTNELGHMTTNMAAITIYGKNLKKSSPEPINQCKTYQEYTNYDSGLTLTHFTPRSNLVT